MINFIKVIRSSGAILFYC